MIYWWNKKFWKVYNLLLSFLQKIFLFVLGVAHTDPFFLHKLGPKMAILEVLATIFQNYWIAIKVINIDWIP